MRALVAACLYAAAMAWVPAHAQSVTLQGMLGSRALLIVDGGPPKTVAVGETHKGVKLISTSGGEAVVEAGGRQITLRLGETPGSVGGTPRASAGASTGPGSTPSDSPGRIVLPVGSGGHFMTQGLVNGRTVTFMVDTGATSIAMGASDADRLGIDYRSGQPVRMRTANGEAIAYRVKLASVRIGDVEMYEQEAVVGQQPMPYLLLGNSFLNRFNMRREHDHMVLERRY